MPQEKNENRFKGFPSAARKKVQTQKRPMIVESTCKPQEWYLATMVVESSNDVPQVDYLQGNPGNWS
jgi:hypothetical protein